MHIICQLLYIYSLVLFARIILSWFPISPESPMAAVYKVLYALTEPVLGPVRRAIPSMGAGGMGLDLSPMIVGFGIILLSRAICR